MKRFLAFTLCLAALLLASCKKEPYLTLSGPASVELSADGGSGTISFTGNNEWTASSSDSWVTVSPSSGTASDGPVTVTVKAAANTTYEDRSATVTIRSEGLTQSVTVRQSANLGVVVPTKSYQIASDARTIDVEVQANVDYSVSVSDSWIKQAGTKGLTSKTLSFAVEANGTYDARSATITIKPQSGEAQAISVTQAQKDALLVSKASYSMPYGGGEVDVKVESNVEFEVKSSVDWIQYVQTKGLSTSTVVLKVSENGTYKAREGKVTLTQKGGSLTKTVTVKQAGRVAVTGVMLNKSSLSLLLGETATLKATVKPDNATDKSVTWSSSNTKVATVDKSGKVTAVAVGTAKITAKAGDKSATCTVTVDGSVVKVGEGTHIPPEGGEYELDIQYASNNFAVEIEKSAKWLQYVQTKALTKGAIVLFAEENEMVSTRSAKVTIKDKNGKASPVTVTVTQDAYETATKSYDILMEFYNAMGGPKWKKKENWGRKDVHLAEWQGVSFFPEKGVVGLSFDETGLQGELPECLGELTSLDHIYFENEPGLTGTLPKSFSKLVKMEVITIVNTSMTSLRDVFGGMKGLRYLQVDANDKMTGPLPESAGNSPALEGLRFVANRFTGGIPASWARLGTELWVGENCLSGILPAEYLAVGDDAWLIDNVLYQKEGYGFDISNINLHGGKFWPKGKVKDLNGKSFSFQDVVAKNKYTVYLHWATWCPFSKVLMPQLKDYYAHYHKDGLEIIATISAGDSDGSTPLLEAQQKEVKEKGYDKWYNYYFFQTEVSSYPAAVPVAEVYDQEGNILFSGFSYLHDPVRQRFGRIASSDLIPFLETLLGPADLSDVHTSKDFSKDGEVLTLQKATKGKGINVVFMGDAYTDQDMDKGGLYETVMKESMEEFFAEEPYKSFRDRFNVYAVKAVSVNDRIGSGYSTALSCYYGTGTTVLGDDDKCYSYAQKVPGIKTQDNLLVCVMVNGNISKGTTSMSYNRQSSVAYTTTLGNVRDAYGDVLRHEAGGHGFAFLADEYTRSAETVPADVKEQYNSMYKQYGWYSNVDFTNDPKKVRWSAFLSDSRYQDEVGLHEGGALYSKGVWRPSKNSIMNENMGGFNAPSRWAIYQRIMKLSGETPSFDAFLKYDAVNRNKGTKAGTPVQSGRPAGWQPGAPPRIVP